MATGPPDSVPPVCVKVLSAPETVRVPFTGSAAADWVNEQPWLNGRHFARSGIM